MPPGTGPTSRVNTAFAKGVWTHAWVDKLHVFCVPWDVIRSFHVGSSHQRLSPDLPPSSGVTGTNVQALGPHLLPLVKTPGCELCQSERTPGGESCRNSSAGTGLCPGFAQRHPKRGRGYVHWGEQLLRSGSLGAGELGGQEATLAAPRPVILAGETQVWGPWRGSGHLQGLLRSASCPQGNASFSCSQPQSVPVTFPSSRSHLVLPGTLAQDGASISFQFRTWNQAGLLLSSWPPHGSTGFLLTLRDGALRLGLSPSPGQARSDVTAGNTCPQAAAHTAVSPQDPRPFTP